MPYRLNAITGELDLVSDVASMGGIEQIDTDSGSVTPTLGVVSLLGNMAQGVSTSGSGSTGTITVIDATDSQKGVVELATDAETIAGSSSTVVVIPSSLTAKLGTQTQYAVSYGNTTTGAFQWTSAATDGQLIIGATGSAPAFASLTSTGGTITFTPVANGLNLEAGAAVPTTFTTDSGSATPAANILNIVGTAAQGISSSGSGNTVTLTISDATTAQKGVLETSTDAESIAGSSTAVAVTPSSLAAKLGAQTANAIPYGAGTSSALSWTSAATDGQLVIGATSAAPAFASLTSTDASITITPGANTLDLAVASSGAGVSLTPYIVGATSSDFTTIQGAIDQAVTDGASATAQANIYIKPGTYTENLTLYDGINLIGFAPTPDTYNSTFTSGTIFSGVNVDGVLTFTSGQVKIYNIQITLGASETLLNINAGSSLRLLMKNCYIYNVSTDTLISITANTSSLVYLDGVQSRTSYADLISFDSGQTNSLTLELANSRYLISSATSIPANSTLSFTCKNGLFGGGFDVASSGALDHYLTNVNLDSPTSPYITAAASTMTACKFTQSILSDIDFSIDADNVSLLVTFDESEMGSVTFDSDITYVKYGCTESRSIVQKMVGTEGADSYSGSDWYQSQAGVQTTNATETTLASVTVNETESITLKGTITAAQSDHTNALGGDFLITARRQASGNVTLIGSPVVNVNSSSAATFTVDVDTGTQTVRIRVTGVAATAYNWVTTYSYQKVLTEV